MIFPFSYGFQSHGPLIGRSLRGLARHVGRGGTTSRLVGLVAGVSMENHHHKNEKNPLVTLWLPSGYPLVI